LTDHKMWWFDWRGTEAVQNPHPANSNHAINMIEAKIAITSVPGSVKHPSGTGMTYNERNAFLAIRGYTSYQGYLASPLWKFIRRRVFDEKGSSCYLCTKSAHMIHHERYTEDNLVGRSLQWMRPICRGCHDKIEVCDGRKRMDLSDVERAAAQHKKETFRHTGFHAPALPRPAPHPNHWQQRQAEAARKLSEQNLSKRQRNQLKQERKRQARKELNRRANGQ
jgi:hypothetical protein